MASTPMAVFKSSRWRIIILPLVIWTALFLPTLHLHLEHGHDHDGDSHQHVVVHGDFWFNANHDHDRAAQPDDIALGDGDAGLEQSGLAALLTRTLCYARPMLEIAQPFFRVVPAIATASEFALTSIAKREHPPPPGEERLSVPTSPRSPPSLV